MFQYVVLVCCLPLLSAIGVIKHDINIIYYRSSSNADSKDDRSFPEVCYNISDDAGDKGMETITIPKKRNRNVPCFMCNLCKKKWDYLTLVSTFQ